MKRSIVAIAALVIGIAAAAHSASPPSKDAYQIPNAQSYNAHFGNMDTDKNGKVNWQEFKAFFPQADEKTFAAIDLNKDQTINHDEWHAFKKAYDLKHN